MISDTQTDEDVHDQLRHRHPGKIIAVHLNYPSRAAQRGRTPAQPSYFLKPSSSLAASGSTLERPAGTELLAFEGEIALVIGEPARRVSPADGWTHVASVTAANDFGLYDLRAADKGSNVRSKGGDGFTPLGPTLIDAASVDPAGLRVRTWVNGELVQEDTSDTLLFPFGRLVADLSQLMTLETGDVILTGTPAGSSVVVPGDVVEVEVDAPDAAGAPSSGRLVTTITEGDVPFGDFGSAPEVDDRQRIEAWGDARCRRARGTRRPPSSSPTSCATCSAPSASRRSACSCASAATPTSSSRACTPTAPGARVVGRARTLRFIPFRPDLFAAQGRRLQRAEAWRSTPSARARCS